MKNRLNTKMQEFIQKSRFSGIVVAVLSFIVIMLFSLTTFYNRFEYALYDVRFKIKPSIQQWDSLAFVNVDEPSINNVGEYPWQRDIYARGLDVLSEIGVKQHAFDFEFLDNQAIRLNTALLNDLSRKVEKGKKIDRNDLDRLVVDNDKILAASIYKLGKVILPFHFKEDIKTKGDVSEEYQRELDEAQEIFLKKASIKVPDNKIETYKALIDNKKIDIGIPIPELVVAAYSFGYTNRDPDIDGIERKIRLVRVYKGRLFFQMGLAMFMDVCGVKKEDIVIEPGRSIVLKQAINPITYQKKDITIPIDEKGMLYINWAGPGPLESSFQHIPFYALIEYPIARDEIYDYFDEQDKSVGKWQLNKLNAELDANYKEYAALSDLSKKKEKYEKIKILRKKILDTQTSYFKPYIDEIESIKTKLNKKKDAELESTLAGFLNYKKAFDIVKQVESLWDKMTLVGMTATGTQDLGVIPIYNEYMMVGTYHNLVNTIAYEAFIQKAGKVINLIIMLFLALLVGYAVQQVSAKMSLLVIIAFLIIINLLNIGLFVFNNIWIDQVGTNLAIFLPSFIIAGIKLMKEEGQKRYIKSAFSRYLAPTVIEKIINSPKALELGGEEQNISIFFSDIAKFSTISEKLNPSELVKLLNEYLSEMTNIILSHGGTVDKYIGDAIMAFYGAPLPYEDHAMRCCRAAIAMKKRLRELQEYWRESGSDILKVRMGMNSGKAVVGNMGSSTQMGYTAMGDAVNLASRLEGVNKAYSTYAMISESTFQYVKDEVEARKLDIVRVVGKEEPIVIYELLGEKGKLPDKMYGMLDKYYKALEAFGERDWKGAISYFQQGLKLVNDDGPSLIYIERCEKYIRRAPSKDWDGVYKLTSK